MKTLYLLRHAKSSWDDLRQPDSARPLNARGIQDGMAMAEHLGRSGVAPQTVLCSPARRTRETLALVLPYLPGTPVLRIVPELYLASPETLLAQVRAVADNTEKLLVIGHNDGMHQFAHALIGTGEADLRERVAGKFPTAAFCQIGFDHDHWREIAFGVGRLERFTVPRDLACPACPTFAEGSGILARLSFQVNEHQMKRLARHGRWRELGPAVTSRLRLICVDEPDFERSDTPKMQPPSVVPPDGWVRIFDQDVRTTCRQGEQLIAMLERHSLTLGDRRSDLALLHIDYDPGHWPAIAPGLARLQQDLALVFAPETPAQVGYRLYHGQPPSPCRRGTPPSLSPSHDVNLALAAILRSCLRQWLGNHAGVCQAGAVEAVHQMRVALRRLRAALSLFRSVALPIDDPALNSDLRNLALTLGHVRDRDVFLSDIVPSVAHALADDDREALVTELSDQRQTAWERVTDELLGPGHLDLVVRLERWLTRLEADTIGTTVGEIAPTLLDKRLKQVRRLGRDLENRSTEERHELRIALKKLRYSLEFFGVLYDERRLNRALAHLVELQQILGLLNDVATAHRLIADLHNPAAARAGGIVVGWNQRDSEQKLRHLVRAWDDFCDIKPFWRRPRG